MKIVIPTFERIEWMPPTITMFKKLVNMGYEIEYITVFPDEYFKTHPLKGVKNKYLCSKEISLEQKIRYIKGISGILYRLDTIIKRILTFNLRKTIKECMTDNAILWVVNEMTVILAGKRFLRGYDYIFTIYELHSKTFKNRNIISAARNAKIVVVPEFTRAKIMEYNYKLKKCPIVIPNKSDIPEIDVVSEDTKTAIEEIKKIKSRGIKTIVYAGGLGEERPLEPILNAIKSSNNKYKLVAVGRKNQYIEKLMKEFPEELFYAGGYVNPEHLQIVKECDIGLLIYVPLNDNQAMNVLFCAPNKIFEYSGFGLPVITNDMPALKFSVESARMGKIADFSDMSSILKALDKITENYNV